MTHGLYQHWQRGIGFLDVLDLEKWLTNGGKGVAMLRARAMQGNGGSVAFGAIPFVLGKAVAGKLAV